MIKLRDKIVRDFIVEYNETLVARMKETLHSYKGKDSKYHMEDSVWTHTLMVMTRICGFNLSEVESKILLLAGLLHDIGKPSAKEVKEDKVHFIGHEGYSTIMAYEVLKTFNKKYEYNLSENDIIKILNIISWHGVRNDFHGKYKKFMDYFRIADKEGAIRNSDEKLEDQYPPRKYYKPNNKPKEFTAIITCGVSASGKTTKRKSLYRNYKVISRDNFMMSFGKENNITGSYNEVYKEIHENQELLKKLNEDFQKYIRDINKYPKENIIVDMTMLSLSSRRKMMNLLNNYNFQCEVFITDIKELCITNIQRKEKENKFIPFNVILNQMRSLTLPSLNEGFQKINYNLR